MANWFSNQWLRKGEKFSSNSLLGDGSDRLKTFSPDREKPQIFEAKFSNCYYYLIFPATGNNFASCDIRVDILKEGTDDEVTDTFLRTIESYKVPSFYGDTLEIDDEHTKDDSPFTFPPLNPDGKKFKVDRKAVSSLEVIKTVLKANTDKLSVAIIGNHQNVTEGNIYRNSEDKKNKIRLNITLGDFMQQRSTIYRTFFFLILLILL